MIGESFWSFTKLRLAKLRGIRAQYFSSTSKNPNGVGTIVTIISISYSKTSAQNPSKAAKTLCYYCGTFAGRSLGIGVVGSQEGRVEL